MMWEILWLLYLCGCVVWCSMWLFSRLFNFFSTYKMEIKWKSKDS